MTWHQDDLVKEYITWILQSYGHCIPRGESLTGEQMAEKIRQTYDTESHDGRASKVAAKVAAACQGRFVHLNCTYSYHPNP
jgi:hypothetical protein